MLRFRDPAVGLYALAAQGVAVVCPRCRARGLAKDRRLSCLTCGHTATSTGRCTRWGVPVDPWFGLPLWFRAPCRGETLWAFNEAHLDVLEDFVRARMRERHLGAPHLTLLTRLPRWIKAAGSRGPVLATIARLRGQRSAGNAEGPGRSRGLLVIG